LADSFGASFAGVDFAEPFFPDTESGLPEDGFVVAAAFCVPFIGRTTGLATATGVVTRDGGVSAGFAAGRVTFAADFAAGFGSGFAAGLVG